MRGRCLAILMAGLVAAAPAAWAQAPGDLAAPRLRLIEAEDLRAPTPDVLASLLDGLRSADADLRRVAVRAIGRLERASLVPEVLPVLADEAAPVRAAAATALARMLRRPAGRGDETAPASPPRAAAPDATAAGVARALRDRLAVETDAASRGAIAQALGRLPYGSPDEVATAEGVVASVLPAGPGVASDRDPGVIGALVALEAMAREHAATFTVSAATVGRLRALVAVPRMAPRGQGTSPPAGDDRWLRRLAFMALQPGGQADDPTVDRALASDDDQLRRLAVRELAARPDGAEILRRAATNDPSPAVRFEALRAMVRRSAAGAPRAGTSTPASAPGVPSVLEPVPWLCDTLVSAIEDTSTHVALLAIDALPGSCPGDRRASERLVALASLAGTHGAAGSSPGSIEGRPSVWPQGTPAQARVRSQGWHRPAHALVALAAIDPPAARPVVLSAAQDPNPWMRLYAARAAGVMAREAVERASSGSPGASGGPAASPATVSPATAAPPESPAGAPVAKPAPDAAAGVQDPVVQALMGLAHDPDANVAEAAVNALRDAVGATGDDVYLHALHRSDYQLVMAAVRALARGAQSDVRTPAALLDALDRITRDRRETSRDPRLAILDALGTIPAAAGEAERLRPHLRDFDPAVAREAAALIERWTGQPVGLDARPLPRPPLPSPGDLDELARTRATIHVRDLGAFDLRLAADEAPLNAFRFITLARAGYYDGLTVHRVVPNFVVQGGSPGANEYAGAGPFSRDEIGVSNLRGTVGVSTRGRDTGDAQFYVNLADNLRLDGTYTVFARVERGMDIVDGLVEGDVIDRVEILTDPR